METESELIINYETSRILFPFRRNNDQYNSKNYYSFESHLKNRGSAAHCCLNYRTSTLNVASQLKLKVFGR